MLVGLLSLGALLAPTVVAAATALVVTPRAHTHVRQRTNHNRVSNDGLPASRWACGTALPVRDAGLCPSDRRMSSSFVLRLPPLVVPD